jgi:hypothetical protein
VRAAGAGSLAAKRKARREAAAAKREQMEAELAALLSEFEALKGTGKANKPRRAELKAARKQLKSALKGLGEGGEDEAEADSECPAEDSALKTVHQVRVTRPSNTH